VSQVDVHVARYGEREEALGERLELGRAITSRASQAEAGVGRGWVQFGSLEVAERVAVVGVAEGDVALGEERLGLLTGFALKPARMAELEGERRGGGQHGKIEKGAKAREVWLEVGGELKEDKAELACGGDRLNRGG
jgi:hypothetical protein